MHYDILGRFIQTDLPDDTVRKDEYDIVLYNHSSVAIIDVKFKAHENDVAKTLKKAETFRILCLDYKDFKIYLGLAFMSFYFEGVLEARKHESAKGR